MLKRDRQLRDAREQFRPYMTPDIIEYVELFKEGNFAPRLSRVVIRQSADNQYFVGVMRIGQRLNQFCASFVPDVGTYEDRLFAKDKMDEILTIEEQEGFDVIDEFSAPRVDILDNVFLSHRIEHEKGQTFFAKHHLQSEHLCHQAIPAGLHVYALVTADGDCRIIDSHDAGSPLQGENLITGRSRVFLQTLSRLDGFRGALFEGFFDGQNLYVTDAGYCHDQVMFDWPLKKRMRFLYKFLLPMSDNEGCRFIVPEKGHPEKWTQTYRYGVTKGRLVRDIDTLFSLQPAYTNRFVFPGTLISETAPLTVTGTAVKNGILQTTNRELNDSGVYYPASARVDAYHDYNIVGHDPTLTHTPLMF
ncbi:MAG: hypothetical protein GJ680_18110 [Alteromonadaceae bacterium]|nr:hypothetical protein [Alteromonadaceae bacterium]